MDGNTIWKLLEPARPGDRESRKIDVFISTVIIVSVCADILYLEPWIPDWFKTVCAILEAAATAAFTVEYLLRLRYCVNDPRYSGRWGRLRWAVSPMALLDLLAFIPTYLLFFGVDKTVLRLLRLFRLLRFVRYNRGMFLIIETVRSCRQQLWATFSGLVAILLISAGALHVVEREAQPDAFGSFFTSLWWAVCTLTTVGFGDIYPVTTIGRFFGSIVAILGIGTFALPAGIIAAHFNQLLNKQIREEKKPRGARICPHCGKNFD